MKNKKEIPNKWIIEGEVFFPIPGNTTIHQSPGSGVFEVYFDENSRRFGLKRIYDQFEFSHKIYDLGIDSLMSSIQKTWESDIFVEQEKNLGVIFYGAKGTGKSIASRILSNNIGLPVIMVNRPLEGLIEFIQSLYFEAVILLDEAEKTFKKNENGEMLLKLVDGALNKTRKMYILTVNNLDINENMLGRPGRIRYVKQFENLTEKAINDYIKDNLINLEKKEKVLKIIDSLEISTIDVLRNIVEEINIHGDIEENSPLNLPKAKHSYKIIYINSEEQDDEDITRFKELILSTPELDKWLRKTKDNDDDITNEDWVYQKIGAYVTTLTTPSSFLYVGMQTNLGEIVEEPDSNGFFYIKPKYTNGEFLCKMISGRENNPSLYRGRLVI